MGPKDREEPLAASPEPRQQRITPVEIQQKEFRLSFRGYSEREVDEFLDLVTEEVARLHAENRRLQEEVEFQRTVPMGTDSAVRADEIVRRAREEADRIVAEARARAAGGGAGPGGWGSSAASMAGATAEAAAVGRFLGRERAFLQSLATVIQRHAEAVKEDARSARRSADTATAAAGGPKHEEEPEPTGSEAMAATPAEPSDAGGDEASVSEPQPDHEEPPEEAPAQEEPPEEATVPEAVSAATESERDRWVDDAHESATRAWSAPLVESPPTWAVGPHTSQPEGPPASVPPDPGASRAPEEDPGEDRSLRELFWGED